MYDYGAKMKPWIDFVAVCEQLGKKSETKSYLTSDD